MKIRTYSELIKLKTLEERFEYLKLDGQIGIATFGYDRYLNQAFYQSEPWKKIRREVIIRDDACDLGVEGFDINYKLTVHHMNPICSEQIEDRDPSLLDPEFLICTSYLTHKAIHFSDSSLLPGLPIERKPGDTTLW